jgi:hypothetical protein
MFLGALYQAFGVNGFAVSTSNTGCTNSTIVKYVIQNDIVTRCDTIYKQFRATYPQLNVTGERCAFLRRSITQGDTNRSANDVYSYLSVMDINGGNVRDLDTLYTWEFHTSQGSRNYLLIDWPAGDYIYYVKEVCYSPCDQKKDCSEIWKVKYNDPSSQTKVGSYAKAYTWAMSLDATKASVCFLMPWQGTNCNAVEFNNLPHFFPPAVPPAKDGWDSKVWGGCGSYLSPSGKHHQHFYGGGHEGWRINTINIATKTLIASIDVTSYDCVGWKTDPSVSDNDVGPGGDMGWARWAVNSDKWIMGNTCLRNNQVTPPVVVGMNQVLVNWIDHKAIVTSRNWQALTNPTACTKNSNDPGDMWVAGGPAGNYYEDVNGKWVNVETGNIASAGERSRQMMLDIIPLPQRVKIYTVQGELLGEFNREKISAILPAGSYIAAPESGARNGIAKISISRKLGF